MKNTKKIVIAVLAVVVVLACMVGVISAYLTKKTQTIVNTFTYGNVNITLSEAGAENDAQTFKMIPGETIKKNADITVRKGSEECYVYVEVVVANNAISEDKNFLSFDMDEVWTHVEGTNLYYTEKMNLLDAETDTVLAVFANDAVEVNDAITADELTAIVQNPTISLTAYAVQASGFNSAIGAWNATFGASDPIETEALVE